jgi:hypothetical protein
LVGASCESTNRGAAYIYVRSGTSWSEQVKLTASDGESGDRYGMEVSVNNDTAIIGAVFNDSQKGNAYTYENVIIPTFSPPTVSTSAAANIAQSSATLNGNLTSMGFASSVNVCFEYGETTSYGNTSVTQELTAIGNYSVSITDLTPGTIYHFRAKAENSYGTATGDDMTFTTTGSSTEATDQSQSLLVLWIVLGVAIVVIALTVFIIARYKKTPKKMIKEQKVDYNAPPPAPTKSNKMDYSDTLQKLADMRDKGFITKEEYESRKNEILRKMIDNA